MENKGQTPPPPTAGGSGWQIFGTDSLFVGKMAEFDTGETY